MRTRRQGSAGVPRTYLVPIVKRIPNPAAVLADLGMDVGDEDARSGTASVTTFVRLTKAQMSKGRRRAWAERRARQKALARPVPASQSCARCKACVRGAVDVCPSCDASLIAVASDAGLGPSHRVAP